MTTLLLRPKEKLQASVRFMQQAGIQTVGVGLIEIERNQPEIDKFKQQISNLCVAQQKDVHCIFVSTHAADTIVDHVFNWPQGVHTYAVGPSTARHLGPLGIAIETPNESNSEGLLALKSLQNIKDKTVFILKGVGGRPLVPTELTARGAIVREIDLYQRLRCSPTVETQQWQPHEITCAVATSGEIIQAAWDEYDHSWLKSLPLIVVSRRLVDFAAKLGLNNVIQSAGASDAQLKDAINDFLEH
ncbi:uroporphyrinogen-III synthase [Aliiglaciecola sp.]|nr:uroporphyrinogen-III synthase [Aliiglaciecola sp.]